MRKIYFLLISFIFLGFTAFSQVTANFTANSTFGCNPLTVTFTSTSTGNIVSYYWDFGNGATSTLQNPTTQYSTSGTYTVILTVTENGTGLTDTKTITNYITVVDGPTANFNISGGAYSGCVPYTGNFNDLSSLGNAPLNNWYWDFGDGTVDNGINSTVSHDFTNPGVYNIFLRVTDTNGCFTDTVINALVSVSTPPVIDFTADKTQYCSVPVLINFTNNTSTYVPASSYSWDFGDGN
ncbi:MAG: cell surface protein, partial [Bacteroidetes bacterium]